MKQVQSYILSSVILILIALSVHQCFRYDAILTKPKVRSFHLFYDFKSIAPANNATEEATVEINTPKLIFEVSFNEPALLDYLSSRFKIPFNTINNIDKYVTSYCDKYNFPKTLIYAIIIKESGFNVKEVSSADCYGLMQVNYNVWKKELQIPKKEYLFDIQNNIKCGFYILNKYRAHVLSVYNCKNNADLIASLVLKRFYGLGGAKTNYYAKTVLKIKKTLDKICSNNA